MYYGKDNKFEEVCYTQDHIENVRTHIKANFSEYFDKYIETESGGVAAHDAVVNLSKHFGTTPPSKKDKDTKKIFEKIIRHAITEFEKERPTYVKLLDSKGLEEYEDDPPSFKQALKHDCPVIRKTLQNKKEKQLDRYRGDFSRASPGELLRATTNLVRFAREYVETKYDGDSFERITTVSELALNRFDEEECTVYGVMGGGIKSQFIYRLFPEVFPYRSRDALWALWYLVAKNPLGCEQDSEFLMINTEKNTTQQNYFYPYDLFCLYALFIHGLLKREASKYGLKLPVEFRWVIVDSFMSFTARCHEDEIKLFKREVSDDQY